MPAPAQAPAGVAGLRAELAEARAEIAGLRSAVRAIAALTVSQGYTHSPAGAPLRNVRDVCRFYGLIDLTETVEAVFRWPR